MSLDKLKLSQQPNDSYYPTNRKEFERNREFKAPKRQDRNTKVYGEIQRKKSSLIREITVDRLTRKRGFLNDSDYVVKFFSPDEQKILHTFLKDKLFSLRDEVLPAFYTDNAQTIETYSDRQKILLESRAREVAKNGNLSRDDLRQIEVKHDQIMESLRKEHSLIEKLISNIHLQERNNPQVPSRAGVLSPAANYLKNLNSLGVINLKKIEKTLEESLETEIKKSALTKPKVVKIEKEKKNSPGSLGIIQKYEKALSDELKIFYEESMNDYLTKVEDIRIQTNDCLLAIGFGNENDNRELFELVKSQISNQLIKLGLDELMYSLIDKADAKLRSDLSVINVGDQFEEFSEGVNNQILARIVKDPFNKKLRDESWKPPKGQADGINFQIKDLFKSVKINRVDVQNLEKAYNLDLRSSKMSDSITLDDLFTKVNRLAAKV